VAFQPQNDTSGNLASMTGRSAPNDSCCLAHYSQAAAETAM
jgi:hypothetical protein